MGACTVDAVSQKAAVTPQLMHKYFGTRSSLFQELFCRQDDRYQDVVRVALADANDFEDIVRVFVTANFDQLSSATATGQLRVVPEIAAIRGERRQAGGQTAERVLVRALATEHPATPEATELVG